MEELPSQKMGEKKPNRERERETFQGYVNSKGPRSTPAKIAPIFSKKSRFGPDQHILVKNNDPSPQSRGQDMALAHFHREPCHSPRGVCAVLPPCLCDVFSTWLKKILGWGRSQNFWKQPTGLAHQIWFTLWLVKRTFCFSKGRLFHRFRGMISSSRVFRVVRFGARSKCKK